MQNEIQSKKESLLEKGALDYFSDDYSSKNLSLEVFHNTNGYSWTLIERHFGINSSIFNEN